MQSSFQPKQRVRDVPETIFWVQRAKIGLGAFKNFGRKLLLSGRISQLCKVVSKLFTQSSFSLSTKNRESIRLLSAMNRALHNFFFLICDNEGNSPHLCLSEFQGCRASMRITAGKLHRGVFQLGDF
jgi:hypothetical protein